MKLLRSGPWLLATVVACLLPLQAQGQVSTTRRASLLFFPKVVADETSDTLIQIANRTENLRLARCFYVNGVRANPNDEGSQGSASIEFDIFLTPSQPTHWVVSRGRQVNPTEPICDRGNLDCEGAGFDPGTIPAVPPGFRGYAFCVETDAAGFPVPGNALFGKATLTHLESGDIATYTAIGFSGLDSNDMNDVLCLGGGVTPDCPNGAEYDGCPTEWYLHHPTEGSKDALGGEASSVETSITIAACPQDLVTPESATTLAQFVVTNEFEQLFSASVSVTGWLDVRLSSISDVFGEDVLGTDMALSRITPAGGSEAGFIVIAQTFRSAAGTTTSVALNIQSEGTRSGTERIVLPPHQ